eukprot:Hpha_TRINITY_DN22407_c0_g1::TRINITY_DN22407_c0_g1_i1::g.94927::m.94927/K11251/H2A; histone H2A
MTRPSTGRPSTVAGRPSTGRSTVAGRPSTGRRGTYRDGLMVNVGFVKRRLKEGNYASSVSRKAASFLAATLEYALAEFLDLSAFSAKNRGKQTITARDMNLAIRSDAELSKFLRCVKIAGGGVIPFIRKAVGTTLTSRRSTTGRRSRGRLSTVKDTGPKLVHPMMGRTTPPPQDGEELPIIIEATPVIELDEEGEEEEEIEVDE